MLYDKMMRGFGVVATAAVVGLVGCSDSGPNLVPVETRIAIADGFAAHESAPLFYASVNGVDVAISPDTVESLTVTLTEISYLVEGGDESSEGAWQTAQVSPAEPIDLMALPSESNGSVVVASSSLATGTYQRVRLLVGEGEIVFKSPGLALGGGPVATTYAVTIPSGDQTGIKTDVALTLSDAQDAEGNAVVVLVFEPVATLQNVTATGNGEVMLTPVMHAK